jgi:hypothetical protein
MKTFKQFVEQADAASNIRSLSPFRVMPPLKKKDGSPNPAPKRYLIDPTTGFGPGQLQAKTKTSKSVA